MDSPIRRKIFIFFSFIKKNEMAQGRGWPKAGYIPLLIINGCCQVNHRYKWYNAEVYKKRYKTILIVLFAIPHFWQGRKMIHFKNDDFTSNFGIFKYRLNLRFVQIGAFTLQIFCKGSKKELNDLKMYPILRNRK